MMRLATKVLSLSSLSFVASQQGFQSVRMSGPAGLKLKKIPSSSLHVSKPVWWLESRFHFSFADHYDPQRTSFGALRVMNDDLVQPMSGFGTHPHRDAEIFSYIVSGELSHADSMGNKEALGRGAVQFMSAGTGVRHSEMNDHPRDVCRFIQIWLSPDARNHKPQYGSRRFKPQNRLNRFLQILGGTGEPLTHWPGYTSGGASDEDVIRLHQDANVLVTEMEPGFEQTVSIGKGRQAYILCIEGSMDVDGGAVQLVARDALQVVNGDESDAPLSFRAGPDGTHMIVVEMKRA